MTGLPLAVCLGVLLWAALIGLGAVVWIFHLGLAAVAIGLLIVIALTPPKRSRP